MCEQEIRKYAGDHSLADEDPGAESFEVHHFLETKDPIVFVTNSHCETVQFSMVVVDEWTVRIAPGYSPNGRYRVVIIG